MFEQVQEEMRKEVIEKRKEVVSDMLNFSVGELVNLYKDEEIDLEPAFQRLFRWSENQQTKFIESLLLGYPVPAIFVYQKEDGIWEVIDGVQRLSSVLNFMGILKNNTDSLPLILQEGDILKKLENKCWDEKTYDLILKNKYELSKKNISIESISPIDKATAIDLKRSRIPVIILSNKSIEISKLELFKRLNSGGSRLCPQEIRNALIYMVNVEKFNIIETYSKNKTFRTLIRLDDNGEKLSFDMEVLVRYLILKNYTTLINVNKKNIEEFFDSAIGEILINKDINIEEQISFFNTIVEILSENLDSEYGFRIFNEEKNSFKGSFSWFMFEIVIYGALKNEARLKAKDSTIISRFVNKIKEIKLQNIQGKKALDRMLNISKEKAEEEFNFGN